MHVSARKRIRHAFALVLALSMALYHAGFALAATNDVVRDHEEQLLPVVFLFEAQHKDGAYAIGPICPIGEPCYAEGEAVPLRIRIAGLVPGQTYTVRLQHDFQDTNGATGYADFRTPTSENGTASDLQLQKVIEFGSDPSVVRYDLTFTAQAAQVRLNWIGGLGMDVADWNRLFLYVRVINFQGMDAFGNEALPLRAENVVNRQISVTLQGEHDTLAVGEDTTYTISATNSGEQDETATITQTLPATLIYVEGSANIPPTTVNAGGRTITWNDMPLPHDVLATTTLSFSVLGMTAGTEQAEAQVLVAGQDPVVSDLWTTVTPGIGTLTVVTAVVGGTATPSLWNLHVLSGGSDVAGSPQPGSATGTVYTVEEGTYQVTATDGPSDYGLTYSTGCPEGAVTVSVGSTAVCTATQTVQTTSITLQTLVSGGTAASTDWQFQVDGQAGGPYGDGQSVTLPAQQTFILLPVLQPSAEYLLGSASGACALAGSAIQLASGLQDAVCTLSYVRATGGIGGRTFEDSNANGAFDVVDAVLPGVVITLSTGLSVTTDAAGLYSFADLPTGTYQVTETVPSGWSLTSPGPAQTVTVTNAATADASFAHGKTPPPQVPADTSSTTNTTATPEQPVAGGPAAVTAPPAPSDAGERGANTADGAVATPEPTILDKRPGTVLGVTTDDPRGVPTLDAQDGRVLGAMTELPSTGARGAPVLLSLGMVLLAVGALGFLTASAAPMPAPVRPQTRRRRSARRLR